jgi:NADH-quinone oxidoreductase subunit J
LLGETILFYVFAAAAIGASLLVIGQRNPIYSVLLLIGSFAALAGLYVLLEAPFLAVIQIIIYAGAIMVVFLFVVMLLNAPQEAVLEDRARHLTLHGPRKLGAALGALLLVELVWAIARASGTGTPDMAARNGLPDMPNSVATIGKVLFSDYALAFEVTSILIIVAMVGAVVLAKREL